MSCRLTNRLRRFASDTCGNVAMIVALSIVPMIGLGGAAIEYVYADAIRTKLAAAADSAALAGGGMFSATESQRQERAQAAFNSSVASLSGYTLTSFSAASITTSGAPSGFRVTVDARTDTIFAKVFGVDIVPLRVSAEASAGTMTNVEVALVLDVTGSMSGAKLAALKVAARKLVTDLSARANQADQVKFSLVPFANYVNVGIGNRNKPWMSVPADSTGTWTYTPETSRTNCRTQTMTGYNDGIPYTYQGEICDVTYGAPVTTTYPIVWQGCAGSRNAPLDSQDGSYSTPIPGIMSDYAWCPGPIIPLTSTSTMITTAIDGLAAGGETYIPAGLIWGWRTLTAGEPFAETRAGTIPDKQLRRFVVLMTDGANTKSADTPYHWGGDSAAANSLTSTLCNNIKEGAARGPTPEGKIGVFTIAFDVSDATINNVLRQCASQDSQYYSATGSAALSAAFEAIGAQLTALRLSK